jgi:Tfp pilus assembly protein PilF
VAQGRVVCADHPQVARHALERLLAVEPHDVYARYTFGTLLQRLNHDDEAAAQFLDVVAATDSYPELQVEACERLGYMAMARGHCGDAQQYFQRALELHHTLGHDTHVLAILHELASPPSAAVILAVPSSTSNRRGPFTSKTATTSRPRSC